ncbi:ABC transporter permease [uncultured Methanoregula sp.]|uniref:ABC transporter permease n=1 Tax=uncultured Methanoregula sp. TaxID=1005933 RepID=UPI002AAA66C8|nr:ABC transporter permease [uncultured Methanoregula sp.]
MGDIAQGIIQAIDLIVTFNPEVMQIALLSLYISLSATILAALVAIPVGSLIHFNEFRGKRALVILIQTLYSVPTVVVGLVIYLLISRSGPFGFLGLLFTPGGMILGQMVLIIPIMMGLVISALGGIDRSISDTLVALGADTFQKIWEILKEARYAILSAVVFGFGRAIAEVGVAMMIGGNIRGHTRVLTTAITLETGMGDFGFSIALGIILLLVALVVVVALNLIMAGMSADMQRIAGGPRG